ncbi:granulysin isoform X2 [Callorhinus ursinus]|uniref:Granulysin isoform X2 n=1 Tax=Callorhinus ursinus TaxID=34884 RepID=A0A3Q7NQY9_CALUR|nr:granulysin isoform X2 [Callorhinus ursinus]
MTSWALLLLASALLATPGLTFSGLSPEDHDLSMADMYEEEQFFEILAEEATKGDQMIFTCKSCKFIIKSLRKILGHNITRGILNDKSPQEICVKIRMCRPEIGLGASGALPHPGKKHGLFSNLRRILPF